MHLVDTLNLTPDTDDHPSHRDLDKHSHRNPLLLPIQADPEEKIDRAGSNVSLHRLHDGHVHAYMGRLRESHGTILLPHGLLAVPTRGASWYAGKDCWGIPGGSHDVDASFQRLRIRRTRPRMLACLSHRIYPRQGAEMEKIPP